MKKTVLYVVFLLQKTLLHTSYFLCKIVLRKKSNTFQWVVGVIELAANLHYISESIPNSLSVCLYDNPFYDFQYSFFIKSNYPSLIKLIIRIIEGPIILGYLLHKSEGFFYIGNCGFLLHQIDSREFEFRFLKSHQKKIICFYVGTDIRSPKLLEEFGRKHDIEVITTYQSIINPKQKMHSYEQYIKNFALTSEAYSDLIFNARIDQISYFTKKTEPFIYFYPDYKFCKNESKFEERKICKICHAPSSPIIKGTQIVRATIKKLKLEGYKFEYVELIGVKNDIVLEELRTAHIVLNEFYAFVPGLFGVEAMASYCALMTSADENLETDLPKGSNEAWLVTKYYQVYDNLKLLLDDHSLLKKYAESGFNWALQHASFSSSSKKLFNLIKNI